MESTKADGCNDTHRHKSTDTKTNATGAENDSQQTLACADCDSTNIRAIQGDTGVGRHPTGEGPYACNDCGWHGDPVERPKQTAGNGRRGLAGQLAGAESDDLRADGGEDIETVWTLTCLDCDFNDEIHTEGHPRDGPPKKVEKRVTRHKHTTDESHVVRVAGRRADRDDTIDPSLVTDGGEDLAEAGADRRPSSDDGDLIPLKCESCDWLHYYRERVRGEDTKLKCPKCHGGGVTRLIEETAIVSQDTKQQWDCPSCEWVGREAPLNLDRWEIQCPDCGEALDDEVAELLEENSDWSRADISDDDLRADGGREIPTIDPEKEPEYVGVHSAIVNETCQNYIGETVDDIEPCAEPATHTVVMADASGATEIAMCDDCGEPEDVDGGRVWSGEVVDDDPTSDTTESRLRAAATQIRRARDTVDDVGERQVLLRIETDVRGAVAMLEQWRRERDRREFEEQVDDADRNVDGRMPADDELRTDGGMLTGGQQDTHAPDLTQFQLDVLAILGGDGVGEERDYGLAIKRALEGYRDEEVPHSRLYQNLTTLIEEGLVAKDPLDKRTNQYALTDAGRGVLDARINWLIDQTATTDDEPAPITGEGGAAGGVE